MKHTIITIAFLLFGKAIFAQNGEFGSNSNGLIYSDTTVKQLKFIVDSLNLKFRVCELNKIYQSKIQGKAHYVILEKGKIKEAKKDMQADMSFDEFVAKYKRAEVEKNLLVIKFKYKNWDENDAVQFSSVELGGKHEHEFTFEKNLEEYDKPLKGKWLFEYSEKDQYSDEYIQAFYFPEELSSQAIPLEYAKMIQYSDCMVDTSTQIFYEKADRTGVRYSREETKKVAAFMTYVNKATGKPEYDSDEYESYYKKLHVWDSLRSQRIDSLRKVDKTFDLLLDEAVKEALVDFGTGADFEEYVGLYYSKKTELEFKRNRIVVGGCSMDNSPRIHALEIARLSAETVNWEIFLRSHLDIMNDNFHRVSDGSYAWGARQTYIKELEVLDINVLDLMLGISLRIENPSKNHYYGSIGRLGRALSETEKKTEIETKMLEMISDTKLDDFNRVLTYYLFLNYNHYLEEDKLKANKEKLALAVKTLPEYISTKINAEK